MERQAKDGTIYQKVGEDDWTPVTRMAKDGTTYKKVGADQWTPIQDGSDQASPAASAVRKFAQGGSFGFSDELAGLAEGAGKAVGFDGVGGPVKDIHASQDGPTLDYNTLKKAYQVGRDKERATLAKDSKDNPKLSAAAEFAGAIASPINKIGQGASAIKQAAGLGAVAGQGYSNADLTNGDANEIGKSLLDTGAGAGLGAATGMAFGAAGKYLSRAKSAPASLASEASSAVEGSQNQLAKSSATGAAKSGASSSIGESSAETSGQLFKYKAPESLEELRQWKPSTEQGQVLGKQRLKEIEQTVPDLAVKPLKYHYDMMENPKAMKELKLKFENLPTEDAKKIASYNQEIVNESTKKIQQTVADVAGSEPRSLSDAGHDLIDTVKTNYNAEKDALGPIFQKIQSQSKAMNQTASKDLIVALGENTKIGQLLEESPETGRFALKRNTPRTGLSDDEHRILSRVVDDLNDGMSFKEVQDTREFLRKAVDPSNPGATSEVNKVRSVLLGQLEHMAGGLGDDVKNTFKAYAVNERTREQIEKIIGGKIESLDALYAANPDRVVQKVFSNPNHAKAIETYIGPDKMKELVGSYLQVGIEKATDSAKGFSPEKFKVWLKKNQNFLKSNVDPATIDRLTALSDYGYYGKRFLDEVNPSGTAASLKAMIEPAGFVHKIKHGGISAAVQSEVAQRVTSFAKQKQSISAMNEALGYRAPESAASGIARKLGGDIKDPIRQAAASQSASAGANASRALISAPMAKPADNQDKPSIKKGPAKWADDGLKKLKEHAGDSDAPVLQKLDSSAMNDPKIKAMLIAASDLKPGSKAMEKVLSKIKDSVGE